MPSWRDLENFLKRDGYTLIRQIGKDKIYEKTLVNGEILRCSVSKGSSEISKALFARILKQQLKCDKEHFNRIK